MGSNSRSFLDLEQQCYSIITLPSANIRESSRILAMISSTSGRRGSSNVCSLTQNEGSGEVISSISAKKADPSDDQRWDTIFAVCFGIALFLDPLFFYMFVIDNNSKCIDSDKAWKITMCAIRSCIDFIYILHVIRKSCNGYYRNATSSRLICLNPSFILDVLSALPVPQVVIFIIAPQVNAPISSFLRNPLVVGLIPHYINRIINAGKFYLKLPNGSRIFRPASFTGLAFGVFVCVVTINGFGALWYFYTIMRVDACWRISCAKNNCNPDTLKCGAVRVGDYSFLNSSCHFLEPNEMKEPTDFDFGIVLEALQSKVAENRNILQKYIYCNWWSLRNLSSLGESLRTSSYILDNVFAIFISFYGLCLFIFLIQVRAS
ncbi:OLC1v1000201C1 [Oldenlandia corymbosa var. corymbosa]|uniref:OLC1v1000201C1 n=1 Tax=Oldenlandia corymbosa var. corymbosa TaxID=529605 RepID=A0AAV1D380_OLDCO|nr:OLC1v1000201C1 [Oldenlandia corymbosa var. corymbosa]